MLGLIGETNNQGGRAIAHFLNFEVSKKMTKTFDKKDVYSWSNCEEARQYIGKFGYFSDCCFDDLNDWSHGELTQIYPFNDIDEIFSFNDRSSFDDRYKYGLFLPAEKVKEVREAKKYRPFKNCKELCQHIHVTGEDLYAGLTLNIRNKADKRVRQVLITEIRLDEPLIGLGTWLFDLEKLFEAYEWQDEDNGDWKPFGVEE